MVNFNRPPYVGGELDNIKQAVENLKICGDGPFTKKCDAYNYGCWHRFPLRNRYQAACKDGSQWGDYYGFFDLRCESSWIYQSCFCDFIVVFFIYKHSVFIVICYNYSCDFLDFVYTYEYIKSDYKIKFRMRIYSNETKKEFIF